MAGSRSHEEAGRLQGTFLRTGRDAHFASASGDVPDRWPLYSLTDADHAPRTVPRLAPKLGMIDQAILRTAKRAPQALRALVGAANARQRRLSR